MNHLRGFIPFAVKLQRVFGIERGDKLADHGLRLLPLVPPQHPDVGHQPRHRTDRHTANFALDVVSDLLHSKEDVKKRKAKMVNGKRMCDENASALGHRKTSMEEGNRGTN